MELKDRLTQDGRKLYVPDKETLIGIVKTFIMLKLLINETYTPADIIELSSRLCLIAMKEGGITPFDIEYVIDECMKFGYEMFNQHTEKTGKRF